MKRTLGFILLAIVSFAHAEIYTYTYSATVSTGQNFALSNQLAGATFSWSGMFDDTATPVESQPNANWFIGTGIASLTISGAASNEFNIVGSASLNNSSSSTIFDDESVLDNAAILIETTSSTKDTISSLNSFSIYGGGTVNNLSIDVTHGLLGVDTETPSNNTLSTITAEDIIESSTSFSFMIGNDEVFFGDYSISKTAIPEPTPLAFIGVFGGAIVFLRRLMM